MQPAVVEAVARSQQFSPLAPLLFATSTCWKGDKVKTFLSHRHATPPALVGKLNWGATRIEAMRWRCVGRVNQIRCWKPAEISAWICNINWHATPGFPPPPLQGNSTATPKVMRPHARASSAELRKFLHANASHTSGIPIQIHTATTTKAWNNNSDTHTQHTHTAHTVAHWLCMPQCTQLK